MQTVIRRLIGNVGLLLRIKRDGGLPIVTAQRGLPYFRKRWREMTKENRDDKTGKDQTSVPTFHSSSLPGAIYSSGAKKKTLFRAANPLAHKSAGGDFFADDCDDALQGLRIGAEEVLGGLAALADLFAVEREP